MKNQGEINLYQHFIQSNLFKHLQNQNFLTGIKINDELVLAQELQREFISYYTEDFLLNINFTVDSFKFFFTYIQKFNETGFFVLEFFIKALNLLNFNTNNPSFLSGKSHSSNEITLLTPDSNIFSSIQVIQEEVANNVNIMGRKSSKVLPNISKSYQHPRTNSEFDISPNELSLNGSIYSNMNNNSPGFNIIQDTKDIKYNLNKGNIPIYTQNLKKIIPNGDINTSDTSKISNKTLKNDQNSKTFQMSTLNGGAKIDEENVLVTSRNESTLKNNIRGINPDSKHYFNNNISSKIYESNNPNGTVDLTETTTLNYQSFNPNSENRILNISNHNSNHSNNSNHSLERQNVNKSPIFSLDLRSEFSGKGNNLNQIQNRTMSIGRTTKMNNLNRNDFQDIKRLNQMNSNQYTDNDMSLSDKNKSFENILRKKSSMTFVDENVLRVNSILSQNEADIQRKNTMKKMYDQSAKYSDKQRSSIDNFINNFAGFGPANLQDSNQVSYSQNFVSEKVQIEKEFSSCQSNVSPLTSRTDKSPLTSKNNISRKNYINVNDQENSQESKKIHLNLNRFEVKPEKKTQSSTTKISDKRTPMKNSTITHLNKGVTNSIKGKESDKIIGLNEKKGQKTPIKSPKPIEKVIFKLF